VTVDVDPVALLPYALTLVGGIAGFIGGRRQRAAAATRDEADAAESLSSTVARLGEEIRTVYSRLSAAEARGSAAETRAAACEARGAIHETEVARLRVEVDRLRAELYPSVATAITT